MFSVKRLGARHCGERRGVRARDGRAWKKRCAGKMDNMIVQVIRTEIEKSTPADIIKTVASAQLGDVVPIMTASYQALNSETCERKRMQTKNFLLIIPADIVKTAASTQLGEVVSFMTAYQAINSETCEQKCMQTKNFLAADHSTPTSTEECK